MLFLKPLLQLTVQNGSNLEAQFDTYMGTHSNKYKWIYASLK